MNFNPPENIFMLGTYAYWLAIIMVHICFAVAVFQDAENLAWSQKRKLWFVNGGLWALATLVGGIITAGIFWAIHHSTLRCPAEPESGSQNRSPELPPDLKL